MHVVLKISRAIGWLVVFLFWVLFASLLLGILRGNSPGAVTGIGLIMKQTFPVMFAPLFIIGCGMYFSKRMFWNRLFVWVSIALITYVMLVVMCINTLP